MSTPENIRNKAYSAARQLVRNRLAENAGAEYEKLGPSDKINVDRAVEKKTDHIKKIALKLIPQIANHEKKRVDSFHKGTALVNYGSPEKDDLHEALNKKFASKVDSSQKKKKEDTKGGKSPHIQMHNTFGEEVALDSAVYKAIAKKAEKSGVDITTLGEVYNRGMAIWYEDTNVSQQQYAFARVNSFINKGKTYFNEDNDLLAENFGDEYHVLYVNKKPATKYRTPNDAKKDMDYLSKNHPDVHLQLKKVSTSISEATYKGKDVPLNKPMAGDVKKSKVYVDPDGDGKAQKVNFGDKTLSIKKNNPDRKKSYCARSGGQGNLNDKTSANYWSRKAWNCEEVDKTNPSNREEGTDKLTKIYKKDTPGQSGNLNEHFNMAFDYQGKPTLAPTAHDLMMKAQGGFAHHNDVQDVMNVKSIKEQIEKAFEATILEEDKNELAISIDSLIDMVNEAFVTIENIRSANIERDAWSQAQILKLERYIQSVAAYIENMDESVRSGETHGVIVPAHTIVSQKTGQSITIPAKTKQVKKNDVILNKGDNPFDGK